MRLEDAVIDRASKTPDALAVAGPDGRLTYGELDRLADRIAAGLTNAGVGGGDRVAIWLEKSTAAVASMQAVLRCGAAYVPIDPRSPIARGRTILRDCAVGALIATGERAAAACAGALRDVACFHVDGGEWPGPDEPPPRRSEDPGDLAYILYTSGSTGRPKGVCISHRNALAFVDWATEKLAARPQDRFANHAPFHFDLSVLDLYAAFRAGASVHLIADDWSFVPERLVGFLDEARPTVWYSVPSVLMLIMEQGGLLELPELSLRALLFAGEPFPIRYLRRLRDRWPELRLLNLYGPTETNVCTCHEVERLDPERTAPVPIGRACCCDRVWARKDDGSRAQPGETGELVVSGPTVMLGYWGREPQGGPYATGDLARVLDDGGFELIGRRDQMVKIRGYRVELGEVEAALHQHPAVREAAVAVSGEGLEARLVAFVVCRAEQRPSLLGLKKHLARRLPPHMIVDRVRYLDSLPKTRTGKIDRRALAGRRSSWPGTAT